MEGSAFTDHPDDRGGPTRYGFTAKFLNDIGWPVGPDRLTRADAETLYMTYFWLKYKAGDLPPVIAWCWLDAIVNHGPRAGNRMLQQGLGNVEVDGIVGPKTRLAAVERKTTGQLSVFFYHYYRHRSWYYINIVKDDPDQIVFLTGWSNRLLRLAAAMYKNSMLS